MTILILLILAFTYITGSYRTQMKFAIAFGVGTFVLSSLGLGFLFGTVGVILSVISSSLLYFLMRP